MIASPIPQSSPILLSPSSKTTLKDSQNASPPKTKTDSQGDNGGGSSNYEDLRGYALWAVSYGIVSAIALKTFDALTSSPCTGGHEIAQQKKEKEKTSSGNSNPPPSICHIVFPSVTLINPTTTTSPDPKKEETAAASASPNSPKNLGSIQQFMHYVMNRGLIISYGVAGLMSVAYREQRPTKLFIVAWHVPYDVSVAW
ncbi:hypothetical protein LOK49_LG11G02890 [Camellia lanceoleosa]|uniref:Uncharacterized protein n=1 Tax=Camellia lanceoleosa TaxID=1840588 RepID=A0ACC0G049_9ERIC|nr:hypothetical protein LOK49_LG11G02890 [Camellia lanceoleosa]